MADSLLFLPDISGFTNFVHNTEIQHSKHIISELLETLIDQNTLGLELIEIEGDALFYFKESPVPSYEELLDQVKKMYLSFHNYLQGYENRRICPCGACESAVDLKLKFVAHSGEVDFIKVKDYRKPHGETVIQAHRILKNSIPISEYFLLSKNLLNNMKSLKKEFPLQQESYDFGVLEYGYMEIEKWKKDIKIENNKENLALGTADITASTNVNVAAQPLFELISNLEYRLKWNDDLVDMLYNKNEINQGGTSHVCVLQNGSVNIESFVERRKDNSLILGEITIDPPFADTIRNLIIVTPIDAHNSSLSFEFWLEGNKTIFKLLKPLIKRKLKATLNKTLQKIASNASELVKEIGIN